METTELLHDLQRVTDANPKTGVLSTDGRASFNRVDHKGYKFGYWRGRRFFAHRVMWALYYGEWPSGCVDHMDGNPANNRVDNLRIATNQQNQWNTGPRPGLKFKGVCWKKADRKWQVRICTKDGQKHVGYFSDEECAARAYDAAARKYHGEFARLNFPQESA